MHTQEPAGNITYPHKMATTTIITPWITIIITIKSQYLPQPESS